MTLMESIIARAKSNRQRIVLPESLEERTLTAADKSLADEIADIVLIGNRDEILALAAKLGLQNIEVINPEGEDAQGRPYGLLRCGTVGEISLKAFLISVKEHLSCEGLRYVDGGKPVRKVAVGGGSCADEMHDALAAGCDTFVTADVKYNQSYNCI